MSAESAGVHCRVCGGLLGARQKTLLGFGKAPCQQCPNAEWYPLSGAYRVVYMVALCGAVLRVFFLLVNAPPRRTPDELAYALGGALPFIVIFGIPALLALLKDAKVRSGAVESNASSSAAPPLPRLPLDAAALRQLESRWYTRKDAASETKGPFEMASIMDALQNGGIGPGSEVRAEGSEDWCVLQEHPDFRQMAKSLMRAGHERTRRL